MQVLQNVGDQPPGLLAVLHVAPDDLANLHRKVELPADLPDLPHGRLDSLPWV